MAEHANNNTKANLPGLTGERVKAVVTILVTLFSLVNAGLGLACLLYTSPSPRDS